MSNPMIMSYMSQGYTLETSNDNFTILVKKKKFKWLIFLLLCLTAVGWLIYILIYMFVQKDERIQVDNNTGAVTKL